MNQKILILEASEYSPFALRVYREIGSMGICSGDPTDSQNKDQATVLVCRLGYHLDAEFLREFPRLRFIVSPTTGLNHIDLRYCKKNQISIISLKGENYFLDSIRSTSELTFSLLLALVRNIVPAVKSVHQGKWNRDEFKGRELHALTLGVLGAGRTGRHMFSYAKTFGMSIMACDPYIDHKSVPEKYVKFCSKEELFASADIVTVHVDYRPENIEMITRRDFRRMKPGSYFINTSRGELVSEDDVVWAMEKGVLAGAALDVLSNEQDVHGIFNKNIITYAKHNDNLIITPHIGGCTSDAMHDTELFVAQKLKHIIEASQDSWPHKGLKVDKEKGLKKGDKEAFDKNWNIRKETQYIHWTRVEPENQIQLAFRNHWILFQEIMGDDFKGNRVIEVGCGRGSMSAYFADNGFDCTLLDSSQSAIDAAKEIFSAYGLSAGFDVGDAMRLPYDNGSFDVVFSIGLLEHFEDIETPLSEQIRVLSKGGLFLGYVVPKYTDNVQKSYKWINDLLKEMVDVDSCNNVSQKEDVFRSDADSERYIKVLQKLPVRDINATGVYPLPMISYSIEFPFTLLNFKGEKMLVKHFQAILDERKAKTGRNPWLCNEGYGQAFLIWCFKE